MAFKTPAAYLIMAGLLGLVALVGAALAYIMRKGNEGAPQAGPQRARPVNRAQAGVRRRAAAAAAAAQQQQQQEEQQAAASDESGDSEVEQDQQPRQQAPQVARTAGAAYEQRRRKKDADREAAEAVQEAELARAAVARAAKQEAEAAEWMGQISVEEQGQEADEQQGQGLMGQFVEYIKERKSVPLEDLAAQFGLRVQDVITRVQSLEKMGQLSGVMDDRGKYLYISTEEMKAVADYIKRRGRIAIGELAAKSNTFIDLEAKATAAPAEMIAADLGLDETVEVAA